MKRAKGESAIAMAAQETSLVELENLLKIVRSDPENGANHLRLLAERARRLVDIWQRPSA